MQTGPGRFAGGRGAILSWIGVLACAILGRDGLLTPAADAAPPVCSRATEAGHGGGWRWSDPAGHAPGESAFLKDESPQRAPTGGVAGGPGSIWLPDSGELLASGRQPVRPTPACVTSGAGVARHVLLCVWLF